MGPNRTNPSDGPPVVVEIFADGSTAAAAMEDLQHARFDETEFGLLTRDDRGNFRAWSAREMAGHLGAAVSALGAIIAVGLAVILMLVRTAVYDSVSTLADSFVGLMGSGVIGALMGWGLGRVLRRADTHPYRRHVDHGDAIVFVQSPDRVDEAMKILQAHAAPRVTHS